MINRNAIIFAAGNAERLGLSKEAPPKPLLNINGHVLIEIIIQNLIQANIKEILIIVGYKTEDFLYLEHKFPVVKLIQNPYYETSSTATACYLVREHLHDKTLLISGDMFMTKNFFLDLPHDSIMAGIRKTNSTSDWIYDLDANNYIVGYHHGDPRGALVLGEWSALTSDWANAIKEELKRLYKEELIDKHIVADVLIRSAFDANILIKPYILIESDQWDIDTPEDLHRALTYREFSQS